MPQFSSAAPGPDGRPLAADADGWISGEQLRPPRQHLAESEVEPFLEWLFLEVGRKPESLDLKEAAAVARYLQVLALKGVPSDVAKLGSDAVDCYWRDSGPESRGDRWVLEEIARVIWMQLFQFAQIESCGKVAAKDFLQRHAQTYLAAMRPDADLTAALTMIDRLEVPPNTPDPFHPPNFMSRSMCAQGEGNPYLEDDLSDRIYRGYQALKRRSPVKRPGPRIASVLTNVKIPNRVKVADVQIGPKVQEERWHWNSTNVWERVKEHEERLRKKWPQQLARQEVKRRLENWREQRADLSIQSFRNKRELDDLCARLNETTGSSTVR